MFTLKSPVQFERGLLPRLAPQILERRARRGGEGGGGGEGGERGGRGFPPQAVLKQAVFGV